MRNEGFYLAVVAAAAASHCFISAVPADPANIASTCFLNLPMSYSLPFNTVLHFRVSAAAAIASLI
jgi:hypothetical protein